MSDDEDADANEQAFAELQENLQEQEQAENSPEVETLPETSSAAMVDFLKPVLKLRGIPVA